LPHTMSLPAKMWHPARMQAHRTPFTPEKVPGKKVPDKKQAHPLRSACQRPAVSTARHQHVPACENGPPSPHASTSDPLHPCKVPDKKGRHFPCQRLPAPGSVRRTAPAVPAYKNVVPSPHAGTSDPFTPGKVPD
jgi:hypothetical protein